MPLAEDFQEILDALPSDWTDMELDLRVQEDRYIDAATLLVTCNAQPYSHHDWHFHINVAHQFGHAAAAAACCRSWRRRTLRGRTGLSGARNHLTLSRWTAQSSSWPLARRSAPGNQLV